MTARSVAVLAAELTAFRDEHIIPNEARFEAEIAAGEDRFRYPPLLVELRGLAKNRGLWNLFLELSNREYAPLAEIIGCNEWAPEVFNCNPPDTGNMGILAAYGTAAQKERWLEPLLAGDIRSCFAMTEPDVASSDATNIATHARRDGETWAIDGRKWFISGPGNPLCTIAIVMCRSEPDAERYKQHSMILVPLDAPGLTLRRHLTIFGFDFAPRGHWEIAFDDVRVPLENVILGPGRGFEVAQGRLGGGRLHHAMRCVGAAERALQLMCERGAERTAFGKPLAELGGNLDLIARSRIEIDMVRALVLDAATLLDASGGKAARAAISAVKVAAPEMACRVVDRAIQLHGAKGLSQDTPLAALYARLRSLRIVDGPDEVHLRVIAKEELRKREARAADG
jgi:acyl-CoA dehydrogenase